MPVLRAALLPIVGLLASWLADGAPPAVNYVVNSIGMKFALVRAGRGVAGSPQAEAFRNPDEHLRAIRMAKPIWMGVYPVTQGEYFQVLGLRPSWFSAEGPGRKFVDGLPTDNFPVERVTWNDAQRFCTALSELTAERQKGRRYRLPTESEFEYAARAESSAAQTAITSREANFNGNHPYATSGKGPYLARTSAVGSYAPNGFGLFEMQGNVWQWVHDWYSEAADGMLTPGVFPTRVLKGCGWNAFGFHCRLAAREKDNPNNRTSFVGFRVVMEEFAAHE